MPYRLPSFQIALSKSTFTDGNHENSRWTNRDLDPVPRHQRKWGLTSLVAYWMSDAFNVASWQLASGIIAVGLSWKDSLIIVALGNLTISLVIALNGATGVIYHAPFPVIARAGWGFWGSYIPIIFRLIVALFWFAIQNVNGGNAVRVMIGAVWPSFLHLKNSIPEEQGITTSGMISYIIFFILQLPFLCMHPNTLRWLFIVKSTIVPLSWIAMLIWAFKSASVGDIFNQEAQLSGSRYSWEFLTRLTAAIGGYATLSVNQADFSRYSRISAKWQAIYIPLLPILFTLITFIGVAVSSAAQKKYGGEILWDPSMLILQWENRACQFFAAFSFALACIGVNVSANSISAANDFSALAPQYINIRRGQLICAIVSWMLVPWRILKSASSFLNFLSAYAIFFGPLAAIMVFDFWVVKERKYDSLALYQPWNIYRYRKGFNWRAIVSFVVGSVPSLPGFMHFFNGSIQVGVGAHPYRIGWFVGFVGTGIVYMALSHIFPVKETRIERAILPDEIYDAQESLDERVSGAEDSEEQGEKRVV